MARTTEAFSRVRIDALLTDAGWNLTDGMSVLFEHALSDGSRADYVLCDRAGRPMAVVEAKRASVEPIAAQDQGRHYAELLEVPFVFLSNGDVVRFMDREVDAHSREIATFYSQEDLERRIAARTVRRELTDVPIDRQIVDRGYQIDCIETLSDEVTRGQRKLLVEMATGTGKTRTAAAFIKRLFEAGAVTRVLFLVDRIALAGQVEDAFTDHLRDYPCHVLRPGRGFDRAKRITIATLQTMIAEYGRLSSGYFDLVITDECHRSIYGKWSGALRHFDGIQLGLTATPCTEDAARAAESDESDPEDGRFVRDTLRFFGVERPTFRYTLRRAIAEGYLVPYRIYRAMTVKTAAEGGFEVRRDELDWTAMDEATWAEFEELFGASDTVTVDPRALERKFTIHETTFFGNDVDPRMVRLATMNLTLRGLDKVRILRRDALTRALDRTAKAELGLPAEGFDIILANPPSRAMPPTPGTATCGRCSRTVRGYNWSRVTGCFWKTLLAVLPSRPLVTSPIRSFRRERADPHPGPAEAT